MHKMQIMGWLRALMQGTNPPVSSLDALARSIAAAPGGSDATRMHPRSLAAMLGKLDRDQELDWLRQRPDLQRALAVALGCQLSAIAQALAGVPGRPTSAERHFAFDDVPAARPLDLLMEPLPSAVPSEITLPGSWSRLWWHSVDALSASLAGRWLEARGMCRVVRVHTAADLDVSAAGPLFVEVIDRTTSIVEAALSLRAPVCVACTTVPRVDSTWNVVAGTSPEALLHDLVRWLGARLPSDGRFNAGDALDWLIGSPVSEGIVDGFESALGCMGLVDRFGLSAVKHRNSTALAEHYFRAQLAASHGSREASTGWLRTRGMALLVALARRLLTVAPDAWDLPRTFEQWLDLVPDEYQKGVDVEWVKLALHDRATLRASDVEKAARRLPPGSFGVVQALARAGVLRRSADERLVFAPRWFGLALKGQAQKALLASSPAEWGEALLGPTRAPEIARHLYERAIEGEPLDHVLEHEDATDPAWVAALEGVFRATGLALCAGTDVPHETLEALWDEQLELALTLGDGQVHPRIEYGAASSGGDGALLSRGAWNLAALAISEPLPAGVGARHAVLRPWIETSHGAEPLEHLFDDILATVASTHFDCSWAVGAFVLVDRLSRVVGHFTGKVHPLAAPGRLVDEVDHDVLEWPSVAAVSSLPHAATAIERIASARSIEWTRVTAAVWGAWDQAGCPAPSGSLLDPDAPSAASFWSRLPVDQVRAAAVHATPNALSCFDLDTWKALVADCLSTGAHLPVSAASLLPPDVGAHWIERAKVPQLAAETPATWAMLWSRFDRELMAKTRTLIASGDLPSAVALLDAAPLERTPELVQLFTGALNWQRQNARVIDAFRDTLHRRIAERAPAWQQAYDLLCRIEDALRTTRRALG